MDTGAQEEPSSVGAGFSWAALGETFFLDSFQAQLGLQVDKLSTQLKQHTDAVSSPNIYCDTSLQLYGRKKKLAFTNFHRRLVEVGR